VAMGDLNPACAVHNTTFRPHTRPGSSPCVHLSCFLMYTWTLGPQLFRLRFSPDSYPSVHLSTKNKWGSLNKL
jgi:hypothetical protein